VKGDLRMVEVLARAVRAYERAPREGIELTAGRFRLVLGHDDLAAVVARARKRAATHNAGRPAAERLVLRALATAYREALDRDLRLGRINVEGIRNAPSLLGVIDRAALARAVHAMWPVLTPEALVRRLLASPRRLASAGRGILALDELDALRA